nr:leucine-rich repeat domain-containing protein [Eubacterium sp.]
MGEYKKRIISFFVIIVMVVSGVLDVGVNEVEAAPGTNGFFEDGENYTEWSYNRNSKTITISGTGKMLMGPDSGSDWRYYSAAEKVVVEEGITTVADDAFSNMNKIKSVELPKGMVSIGARAFNSCSSLSDINLPEGIEKLGDSSFENTEIEKFVVPDSVKELGKYVLQCARVKYLKIPDSVTSLPDGLVQYSSYLKRVDLPKTVVDISGNAFSSGDGYNFTIFCANDEQIQYCEDRGIKYIDARAKYDLNQSTLKIIAESIEWSGNSIKPMFTYKIGNENMKLVEGIDYTAIYGEETEADKKDTVTISGKGIFEGEIKKTYTISKLNLANYQYTEDFSYEVNMDGEELFRNNEEKPTVKFDGEYHTFDINLEYKGVCLVEGKDYRLEGNYENILYGNAYIQIKGIGNYTGDIYVDIPGINVDISELDIELEKTSVIYSNQYQNPIFSIKKGDYVFPQNSFWYNWTTDGSSDFVNARSGKISLYINNIQGEGRYAYEIKPADIEDMDISFENEEYYSYGEDDPAQPVPKISHKVDDSNSFELSYGTDYEVKYENNIETGTAVAKITGKGNYTGRKDIPFNVKRRVKVSDYSVKLDKDTYTYTGKQITPQIKEIKLNGDVLTEEDYEVRYISATSAGEHTFEINGKGKYEGVSFNAKYEILPATPDILDIEVEDVGIWSETDEAYTQYSVKIGGSNYTGDYNVTYENNVGYGTGTIKFTFNGDIV